jgi:hypothetical protein
VAEALEDAGDGDAGLGEERVVIAGDEEGDAQGGSPRGGRLWAAEASNPELAGCGSRGMMANVGREGPYQAGQVFPEQFDDTGGI